MKKICILFIFFSCLRHILSDEEEVNFVYNSIPYKTIDVQDRNGSSKNIKVALESGVVAVALG